jgi:hypothetical protein
MESDNINIQDTNVKDTNVKDTNVKDPNVKDVNIQDVNIQDVNIQDVNIKDEPIKRKKGRPRKEILQIEVKPEEKKKRGRKKKEVVVEEVKQKKKRGRKAAVKYFSSSIRKKIPLTTVLQDNNNYILHLNVKDEDDNDNDNENCLEDCDKNVDKSDIISQVFEKLQIENEYNISELQKEYDDLVDQEESILSDIMNNQDDLTDLYEKRIENREHQDNVLFSKLETYHKDNNVIDKIFNTEDIVEKEDILQEENRKKGFFELLHQFVKNESWLHKTNVCCWWCCHTFDTVPIGIPEKYDQIMKKFLVKGVFCSFSCMMAYNKETDRNSIKNYLIKFLYTKLTGTFLLDIQLEPAPPRCTLKMFGGDLTIEEFRNSLKENKVYKMIQYPMYVCKDYIEEVDIQNVKKVNQNVFAENQQRITNLDDKRIEDARIRLSQIEKTTITLGNTIDKFIKFS